MSTPLEVSHGHPLYSLLHLKTPAGNDSCPNKYYYLTDVPSFISLDPAFKQTVVVVIILSCMYV